MKCLHHLILVSAVLLIIGISAHAEPTYDATGTWSVTITEIVIDTCDAGISQETFTIVQSGEVFSFQTGSGDMIDQGGLDGALYIGSNSVSTINFTLTSPSQANGRYATYDSHTQCALTYDFTMEKVSLNQSPVKPIPVYPVDGATGVEFNTVLQTDDFSDPDIQDTHKESEWQISTSQFFSTIEFYAKTKVHLVSLETPELLMRPDTTYYWRVRFYDNNDNASDWSDAVSFTIQSSQTDVDGNGIPDALENETLDMNVDGIIDMNQSTIRSLNTIIGDGRMGVSFQNTPSIVSIEEVNSIDPDTVSEVARPQSMPLGLFSFRLILSGPGLSVEVTVYLSERAPVDAVWYMYDSINGWTDYSQYATFSADRKTVTLQLQDGGHGDSDGVANGVIVDPGGFGIASWIKGVVTDSSTGIGITTAEVEIPALDLTLNTLTDGNYLSMILPGTYDMEIKADGYEPKLFTDISIPEASIVTKGAELLCKAKIKGVNVWGVALPFGVMSFDVDAQSDCSNDIQYRFSYHPDYGTSNYTGVNWAVMTSEEYTSDKQLDYLFSTEGKYIIVAWAVTDKNNVNSTSVPMIGWSLDIGSQSCKTIISGISMEGDQKNNTPVTIQVNAQNSCTSSLYYRFSVHPDYGTSGYDGLNWSSMTDTEWVDTNTINYTFTKTGKYVVVVWVTTDTGNVNPNGIPIIGWIVDID